MFHFDKMNSRQGDNSSLKMYPVVHTKLKHLICTNCKHAFSSRGVHQFRGKVPFLLECGHAICETCVKTTSTKTCTSCGIVYPQNLNEQGTILVNLYLLGLMNSSQSVANSTEPNIEFQQPTAARFRKSISEDLEHCSECGLKAEFRCRQCEVFFCNSCYAKIHGRALQNHQKISLTENFSEIYNFLTTKCEIHPLELIQFHCTLCDVPTCTHCLLLNHQGHNIVTQSQKIEESKPQIDEAIEKLAETLQRVKMTEKKLAKPLTLMDISQDSETEREKIEARLTQHFSYLHGVLQNIENRFITQLQERQNFIGNNINAIKEQLKEQTKEIENAIMLATSALRSDSAVNITAVMDKLEETLTMPCHLVHNSVSNEKIILDIDQSIVNSLEEHCSMHLPEIFNYSLARTEDLPDDYEIEPIVREEIARPALPAIAPAQLTLSRNSLSMSMLSLRSTDQRDQRQDPENRLVEGSSEAVKITHIKDPSCFYTQSLCRSGILLQLHKQLAKQAATSPIPTELVLNKMYLVQYGNDMKWYRGRVKCMYTDVKKGQSCDIFYVDYGNTECSVPIKRMRNMSLQSSLVPLMARQCTLHDIVPIDGQWEIDANRAMYEMIEGVSHIIMHVFKVQNDVYHVDIIKNSAGDGDYTLSVRDALIFLEYGCFVTNEKLRRTNHQSLRKFFEEDIAIENIYDVRATHIESPDCIYVQKIGGGVTHVLKLTEDVTEEYGRKTNKGIIYTPQIGMPCAALYNDGKWYRGRISNLLGNQKVEVFFVDFGDKCVYKYDEIRRLHYKFLSMTALAFRISLKDLAPLKNNEWDLKTKEFMNQHLLSQYLKIFVFSKESDCYKVTLYIPMDNADINFNALLAQEKFALSTGTSSQFINNPKPVSKKRKKRVFKPKKLTKRNHDIQNDDFQNEVDDTDPFRMQVNILQAVSPDCIYVSDIQSTKAIKKMTEEIQDFYNKYKSLESEDWEKDGICIAYSAKDKSYHRSKIVEISAPDKVEVFLYDIGVTETVTVEDLQSLHPKFSTLPARAFKIKLAGILPCGGSTTWLSSSCEVLSDLINKNQHSRFYISKAAGMENNAMSVDLWVRETRTEGPLTPTIVEINSIKKKLVEKGVALPVKGYKDETNKVLTVDLRQQLLQSDEKSMSTEVEWVVKNELPSCPSDVTSDQSAVGSSPEISDVDSVGEGENADIDADIESDDPISLPPPLSAWIPPAPITDDKFCAVSTNVDQDCVIYLHSQKQSSDILSYIDTTLQAKFTGSKPKSCDMNWAPNDLCIAQFHVDEKWYRAQVLEVLENDEIKVIFVDYGNVDECKLGTLRKRVITGHIPIQATKCVVQGLIPDTPDGKWTVPELDVIHALVVDKKNDVTVLERHPDHLVISMTLRLFNNMDLVAYLRYKLNFKIRENVSEKMFTQEASLDADSELDSLDNADVVIEECIEDYIPATIAEPSLLNLGLNLELTSSEKKKSEDSDTTVTSLMDISGNQVAVIDLDVSGDTFLNSGSIMELDDNDHLSPHGTGSYDRPIDVSTPVNEENDDFIFRYKCIDVPENVQIINLEPQHIAEPTVFYARLDASSKVPFLDMFENQFTLIERRMQSEAYNPPKLKNIKLNAPCCARYTLDNKWYRAIITAIDPDSEMVEIQYVDYGNSECQPIDNIHCLPEAWLAIPIMTLKCRLSRVRVNPDKPSWRKQIEKFERIFYRGTVKAKIKERYSGILDVELYSDEDCTKLLYDFLLEDGLLEIVEE